MKTVTEQLIDRFGGIEATEPNRSFYRKITKSWCELLVIGNGFYIEKSPFSGDCDMSRIRHHVGCWKKAGEYDRSPLGGSQSTALDELVPKQLPLIHPNSQEIYDRAAALSLSPDELKEVIALVDQGDIMCATAYMDGIEDSRNGVDYESSPWSAGEPANIH